MSVPDIYDIPPRSAPFVLGIGGTLREQSSSERALRLALQAAEGEGAETLLLPARVLDMPAYGSAGAGSSVGAGLIAAVAQADAIVLSSPGYHGGVSGLLKNALDYLEELRDSDPPYLDGRPVGCIACASGWQGATTTLLSMRSIVHALRGWPTPLGVTINSAEGGLGRDGAPPNEALSWQLQLLGRQVVQFARLRPAPTR
jgi:FMN reductase